MLSGQKSRGSKLQRGNFMCKCYPRQNRLDIHSRHWGNRC
uniref:Uncharacterized protein n=1 Tax=Arundo donax TaxID=35708 RepID=A0A0A8Y0Q5_ARUDO